MIEAEPMASRVYDFGTVELHVNPHSGGWVWRCLGIASTRRWSAIGYRTQQDAYDAAARRIRGVNPVSEP